MTTTLTEEQAAYLREHRLAVLGTGRRDGSPALATVMYDFDGSDLVISTEQSSAKWKNAVRQPRVALLVADGRRQLILYGTAEALTEGAPRREGWHRLRAKNRRPDDTRPDPDDATLDRQLDERGTAILRVTPERVRMND